jgi:uncharacterized protein (TIGR00369 family)
MFSIRRVLSSSQCSALTTAGRVAFPSTARCWFSQHGNKDPHHNLNLNEQFDHPNDHHSHNHHNHQTATPTHQGEERYGGMSREVFTHLVEEMAPFMRRVFKIKLHSLSSQQMHIILPYNRTLVGNIAVPCLHGGAVASVIDHVGGFASWGHLDDPFLRVNTADLRVDYLAPAPCEELHFIATIQHRSKRLIRTDVVVYDKDMKKKIAIGRCLFNIYREGFNIQEVMESVIQETNARKAQGLPPIEDEEEE